MSRVFISYRREDSADITGRIHDGLERHLSPDDLFRDIDDIPPGVRFADYLVETLRNCSVILAVIGQRWDGGRLQNDEDYVRKELEYGLTHDIPIIPVLVHGAEIPSLKALPPSIADVTAFNAVRINSDSGFRANVEYLSRAVARLLAEEEAMRSEIVRPPPTASPAQQADSAPAGREDNQAASGSQRLVGSAIGFLSALLPVLVWYLKEGYDGYFSIGAPVLVVLAPIFGFLANAATPARAALSAGTVGAVAMLVTYGATGDIQRDPMHLIWLPLGAAIWGASGAAVSSLLAMAGVRRSEEGNRR